MTLNLRAIHRLVQSSDFQEIWSKAWMDNRVIAEDLIARGDALGFRAWIKEQRIADYRDMSYRQLLELCKRYRIKNYSRLMKEDMIRALSERDAHDQTST